MRLKELLTPVPNMDTDDAKSYLETHSAESVTLLDVRQPVEYKAAHIPGAKLIPLPELFERAGELDADKPVIVY